MARFRYTRTFRFRNIKTSTPDAMLQAGEWVAAQIVARTQAGLDEDRRRFKPYTPAYAKWKGVPRTQVDLTLSGDMLGSFGPQWASATRVKIGWPQGSRYEQRARHNEALGRHFLGVPRSWMDHVRDYLLKRIRL